eukprot:scaffold56142_cov15-Tisochrysis_lutea.AAC.2
MCPGHRDMPLGLLQKKQVSVCEGIRKQGGRSEFDKESKVGGGKVQRKGEGQGVVLEGRAYTLVLYHCQKREKGKSHGG